MNTVKRGGKGRRSAGSKQGRAVRTSGRPIRPSFPPSLYKRFLQIAVSLEKEKVDYSLIGGFAMVLHGLPRMTQDLDVFVRPDRENVKRLIRALKKVFKDEELERITLEELEKYPVIRYGSPDGFFIDILVRIGSLFTFEDLDSRLVTVEGRHVRVATPETLYRLKKDTLRPIDREDARFLERLIGKKGK